MRCVSAAKKVRAEDVVPSRANLHDHTLHGSMPAHGVEKLMEPRGAMEPKISEVELWSPCHNVTRVKIERV